MPLPIFGMATWVFARNCISGLAVCGFWFILFMIAPLLVFLSRQDVYRNENLVIGGMSVLDWAPIHEDSASEVFLFTDGHVATDLQVGGTYFYAAGEYSKYRSYSIAPVFADASCTSSWRMPPASPPPDTRCDVAFILFFSFDIKEELGGESDSRGCAGCAANATHTICTGEGRGGWPSCGYGSCKCPKRPVSFNASDFTSAWGGLSLEIAGYSKYACEEARTDDAYHCKDQEDDTEGRNPLPHLKCLEDLVPSLDERFQASARIACRRPWLSPQHPSNPAATLRRAHILYVIGAGLVVVSLISNLILPKGWPG